MRILIAGLVATMACAGERPFFEEPTQPLPGSLSALGLAPDRPVPAELRAYAPLWPLWSSGSDKTRLVFLPEAIDTTDAGAWTFPIGTTFFKTFAYGPQRIETRVLRLLEDGWRYDVYLWAEDGSDATLIELDQSVVVGDHTVPSRLDCRTCHESAPQPVLGFNELQLDDDTLAALDADALRSAGPTTPARIAHADPATAEIRGIL